MAAELVPVDTTTGEIVERHDTDSWVAVVADVARLAEHIATTEFVPRGLRNNVPATTAAILYGRELGLPPMTALSQISVIEGRPALSAEGMRALVLAAGHDIEIVRSTTAECVMRGRRRGSASWSPEVAWNADNVRAAGLGGKDVWKRYPRQMLMARATTELCRNVFPDVIHGFRSVEEIGDVDGEALTGETPTPPTPTTKVTRKRAARKTTETTVGEAAPQPAVASPAVPVDPPPPPLPSDDLDPVTPPPVDADQERTEGRYGDDQPLEVEELPPDPVDQPERHQLDPRLRRDIILHFGRMGLDPHGDRDQRLMLTSRIVGRPVETTNDLTPDEGEYVLATVRVVKNLTDLKRILDVVDDAAEGDQ